MLNSTRGGLNTLLSKLRNKMRGVFSLMRHRPFGRTVGDTVNLQILYNPIYIFAKFTTRQNNKCNYRYVYFIKIIKMTDATNVFERPQKLAILNGSCYEYLRKLSAFYSTARLEVRW